MTDNDKIVNFTTFEIRGRVLGGSDECCIKGCPEIASNRKITCLAGVYELKLSPDLLSQANDHNINIWNHHYYLQKKRGHKPKRIYSSVESAQRKGYETDAKSERDDWFSLLGLKKCTSCQKNVVVAKTSPCPQHILTVSSKSYMCACNCLDEKMDGKIQQINSDIYDCISNNEEGVANSDLEQNYICTECSPSYLQSLKSSKSSDSQTDIGGSGNKSTHKTGRQESAAAQQDKFLFQNYFMALITLAAKQMYQL